MANIRTVNEIVQNLIDLLRVLQPDMDIKPGEVARDLFIEAPASMQSLLYEELSKISNLQSLRLAIGIDLDRLAQNFGATRNVSTKSTGIGLLTFNSIPTSIAIDKGSLIFSNNGNSFLILNGTSVNPVNSNLYKSIATKYKTDLDFVGITDTFAVEVSLEASTPGIAGNLSKYSLNRTTIPGVSNVTNILPITGGTNQEDDSSFRNRILAIFSGSNIGTALGYKNIALSDSGVLDALVIEPGDSLMTRDGTQVSKNTDGSYTIISEGQGGKLDVVILGSRLDEHIDSFIFRDLSNKNDPTDIKNIIVLGQILADLNKTVTRKRIDDLKNGELPAQPVQTILEVSGSLSGSNFKEKEVDSLGRISGNFEIIKDTGVYGGSPFGFDKFHWISNKISLFNEDRIKSSFNSQDNVTFSDVLNLPKIQQNIQINNENSLVSNIDKSVVQLLHTPVTNITRVFNVNTGERYTIVDQNLDGDDTVNTTGRIKISGNSLPSVSDILQVDYTWIVDYDPYIDYDGKYLSDNPKIISGVKFDVVDWGYSNLIRSEFINLTRNSSNSFFSGNTNHNISSIINIKTFEQAECVVSTVTDPLSPLYLKKIINVNGLLNTISNIENIVLSNTTKEMYNTFSADGSFSSSRVIISGKIRYNNIVVFPTDSIVKTGDNVSILFNSNDIFTVNGNSGNFNNTQITIPVGNFVTSANTFKVKCAYTANVSEIFSSGINVLPTSRLANGFTLNNKTGFNNLNISNISRREHKLVQLDSDGYFYVTMSIGSAEFLTPDLISIIRLSDNAELMNSTNAPTISVNSDGYYKITLSGLNSPVINDSVLVLFFASDVKRFQPTTFSNDIIRTNLTQVKIDSSDGYYTTMHDFINETNVHFSIIDSVDDTIYLTAVNGVLTTTFDETNVGSLQSGSSFASIENITNKKLQIYSATNRNNNGVYDISAYNSLTNTITIKNIFNNLDINQISIVRISDGQELWNTDGTISIEDNKLSLPGINFSTTNDKVIILYSINRNLKQSPTKLSVNITDQVNTSGVITIAGKTITKVKDIVFTAISNSLTHNLAEAMRTFLGLDSTQSISTSIKIARLVSVEKVSTTTNNEVIEVLNNYDVHGYYINDNTLYANESFNNQELSNLDFTLPSTTDNIANKPEAGDSLRVVFYYLTDLDSENLFFTRNGTIFTNKTFSFIDSMYVSSGFTKSQSSKITISNFNQPLTGSRYKTFYDYIGPKENERIIIRYNFNKLISDVTLNIESQRPLNADVIVRSAKEIKLDLTMNIVIKDELSKSGSAQVVIQNLNDKLIAALNSNTLGAILDASDLINIAYGVDGIDRARILYFNKNGETGQVLSVMAQKDEYFIANNVIVNSETR